MGTFICRALVRADATGAKVPAEIWQQVPGTRPEKGAIILNYKYAPKVDKDVIKLG